MIRLHKRGKFNISRESVLQSAKLFHYLAKFIALIDKYQGFDTMTNTMLNEFVDKILVHERDRKGCQDTTQTVEIYFNFVGRYIPPSFREAELTPEEQEAFRRREERRDKLHQAYLRRKASGKQQEYRAQ